LRKNENGMLVHLVNVTSDMKRPMDRIVPLYNIEISVRTYFNKARSLSSGKLFETKRKKDRLSFIVPQVNEYEIVLLSQ
ncbi:MAG: hypothetical protein NC907_06045, partial [Candidatus Omnitrophica bacterium]|nr:hypothetical protein [Candidatus Omnitrophota bacterium]